MSYNTISGSGDSIGYLPMDNTGNNEIANIIAAAPPGGTAIMNMNALIFQLAMNQPSSQVVAGTGGGIGKTILGLGVAGLGVGLAYHFLKKGKGKDGKDEAAPKKEEPVTNEQIAKSLPNIKTDANPDAAKKDTITPEDKAPNATEVPVAAKNDTGTPEVKAPDAAKKEVVPEVKVAPKKKATPEVKVKGTAKEKTKTPAARPAAKARGNVAGQPGVKAADEQLPKQIQDVLNW